MNVNLDVLELIFAQLDGSHLVNAALVSRAFLAGAIPALYAHIEYTLRHAKRAQHEMSPFAALVTHAHLAVHVKRIAVHAAPLVSSSFLDDLSRALRSATNLRSFVCTVKILPPLLPHLDKPRLHHIRICAPLASRQTAVLQNCTHFHSLSLDFPSWNVIDALPIWATSMQKTLAHLTLFMSQDTNVTVLNTTLGQLPRLRGLHLIGCPKITHTIVLKALSHTPDLRELSFTIFPSQENTLPTLNFATPPLTHLSIDIRASHPGLKSLTARIISRLSPRDALAICGGWIGEIRGLSERADPPPNGAENDPGASGGGAGPFGQNFHVWHGHVHLHGPMPGGHGHDQANDLPLLTPANLHHGHANPIQNPPAPPLYAGNLGPPFPPPLGNQNGNNNDLPGVGPPNPHNLDINPDPDSPSLIDSFPPTLSTLHLPQISPAGLREVVDRCKDIQLLGIVIGNSFTTSTSAKSSKTTGRSTGQFKSKSGMRPEVSVLSSILSRARALRELIIDTGPIDIAGHSTSASTCIGTSGLHGASSGGYTMLTPLAVRMLMRESPLLRRIVAEGRVWESPTPAPSSPIPFPHCLDIELSLTKARYSPGAGYSHTRGLRGFGTYGGGYGQMEAGNDHWFWLTNSGSGGRVYGEF